MAAVCSRSGCRAHAARSGANVLGPSSGAPASVPRHDVRSAGTTDQRSGRRRSPERAQLGAARRRDRLAGRRLLHRQLHSTGDERQRLDLYPELGALEPAGCGHAGGPGSGEPHAEDRQPQHRTRDQHGGRRPPLPVRRRRDHDDVGVDERHQLRAGGAGGTGRQHLARASSDRHRLRPLLHPRHAHR